jgi:predicted GH43/DUF377 family glycosyl hydrolase/pimeloyl-ACP methyl ester carboxylesterase
MKRLNFIFILLFLILSHNNTYAVFSRASQNPILTGDQIYDNQGVMSPSIVKTNDKYKLYYVGKNGIQATINLAESDDGVIWTKYENNPVIIPNSTNTYICEKNVDTPNVLYDDESQIYKIWFAADCEPQSTGVPRSWIKYGYSYDGINWIIQDNPVIVPQYSWEIESVSQPTVLKKDGKYVMWYAGRNSAGKQSFGYAESNNGIAWNKDTVPNLSATEQWEYNSIGGPSILYHDKYYLYYHSSPSLPYSIVMATSEDGKLWTKDISNPILTPNEYESALNNPEIIIDHDKLKLYYTNIGSSNWQISLATEDLPNPPIKYVIIPGFFGSWNQEAILHNQNDTEWELAPFITEYDGLQNTFNNLGLVKGSNYYIFSYDWRASLNNSADKLNEFINEITDDATKVDIIGHSLGGLVARIYAQKYGQEHIDKLFTIGSPHHGTAQVYKAVEAGELDRSNTLLWLSEKLILQINKDGFESDKHVLNSHFPILTDLLPTFDFLKLGDEDVDVNSMQSKNQTLISYEDTIDSLFPMLETMSGEKGPTLQGYEVEAPGIVDNLLGNYHDGKPISVINGIGDYLILSSSAKLDSDFIIKNLDHGELIYTKDSIETILDRLGLIYDESQIEEGTKTVLSPSLIFAIKSPAELEVSYNGNIYHETDGIVFIPNAQEGTYELKAKGKEKGKYTIITGKIFENSDVWDEIKGEIVNDDPTTQIDIYHIPFISVTPTQIPTPTPTNTPIPTYTPTPTLTPQPTQTPTITQKPHPRKKIINIIQIVISIFRSILNIFRR